MEHVTALELELTEAEYRRFFAAFDDKPAFMRLLAEKRQPSRVTTSPKYRLPRHFGGRVVPDSKAAGVLFERFQRLRPLFLFAVETGLRRGDLLGLRWDQVDLDGRWIRIEAMRKTKRKVVVPLTAVAVRALLDFKPRGELPDQVFVDEAGKPLGLARVIAAFKTAKAISGIASRRFRFHDLRHSCACRLVDAGVNLPQIAAWLGHTSTRVTERYVRPSVVAMVAARDALDRRVGAAPENSTAPEATVSGAVDGSGAS